jgi:hypothetical protein
MQALNANTTASNNVAVGFQAGYSGTTGNTNTLIGKSAGYSNTVGNGNVIIGHEAGYFCTGSSNTFVGGGISGVVGGAGVLMTTGSKNTIIGNYSGNQGGLDIRTSSNNIVLSDGDGNPRFAIDNNGSAALGRVPNFDSARTALQIVGGAIAYQVASNGNSTIYANNFYYQAGDRAVATGYAQGMVMNPDSTGRILMLTTSSITTAGSGFSFTEGPYVARGGTSWTSSSDERLKNITGEIANGLEKVCSLRAAEFTWKSDESAKPCVGLIAQDVQSVLPEVITANKKYNSEDTTEYLGISYTDTIPLLVAAIKELKAEVDSLKAQLNK